MAAVPENAQVDRLSGDFIIYQPRDGQRYTTDDLLVAWFAVREMRSRAEPPASFLDLGSGLCSVPMILLWAFPALTGSGPRLGFLFELISLFPPHHQHRAQRRPGRESAVIAD